MSLALTAPLTMGASSTVVNAAATATGASLVPVTVITKFCVDVAPWSSVTVKGTMMTFCWPTPKLW